MKTLISDPFDFHHLTHTNPAQFQGLDTTRENDLVTEFSAIRASQRAGTELKGIRAEDLQYRYFAPEEQGGGPITPSEEPVSFAISTPDASPSPSSASPQRQDHKPKRESRIFDNFSRPVPRYPRAGATTPPTGSPRPTSPEFSEPAPLAIDEVLGLSSQQSYPEHDHPSPEDTRNRASLSQLNFAGLFGQERRASYSVHNRGLDTRASSTSLSTHALDLEDVPEEEEGTKWHDSPEPNTGRFSRPSSSLDEPLSEAPSSSRVPRSQLSIYTSADLSKKFFELGSPTLPEYNLKTLRKTHEGDGLRSQLRNKRRNAPETTYESWDADIDYCYEHAAEADTNFDWSRNSLDEPRRPEHRVPIITSDGGVQGKKQPLHPIRLSPSALPKSDLDPSPARSSNSQNSHAATPSTSAYEGDMADRGGDYFHPVSSSEIAGKQTTQDALYEDYLAADAESDRHFSFSSHGAVQPMDHSFSPRSSFSPISKCNSQESLMISRAASIARKHRSSVSTTSVPDLVHSLSASREYMPADQVLPSEQSTPVVAAFSRPGSASHSHRHTKSLARELGAPVLWRDSNSSLEHAASANASPIHDRAKSASEVERSLAAQAIKADSPHPANARKGLNRKKHRTSYSLFPFPGGAH